MIKKIVLSEFATEIIKKLEAAGYEAYAVGGCVRNGIMKIPVSDYDITTSALPKETEKVLKDYKIAETGIKHGTITVMCKGNTAEITTFRVDGEYKDCRRPENVFFTCDLTKDLARRDFTVNAIAYSESKGIIDIFDGESDIKTNTLRCVGEAEKRFEEDALRIMRGLRFMTVYGFKAEKKTALALHNKKHLLKAISPERVNSELCKMLCGKAEYLYPVLMEYYDILGEVILEILQCVDFDQKNHYHNLDVWEHTVKAICSIEPVAHLRLAMLFHDLGKPYCYQFYNNEGHFKGHASISGEICEKRMKELRFDNETLQNVLALVKRHDMIMKNDGVILKKQLNKYGENLFFDLIKVHIADDTAKSAAAQGRIAEYKEAAETAKTAISQQECFSLKKLAVNGNDIIKMGFRGKEVGAALSFLLNAVMENKIDNNYNALTEYLVINKEKM